MPVALYPPATKPLQPQPALRNRTQPAVTQRETQRNTAHPNIQPKVSRSAAPPVYRPNNALPRAGAAQLSPRPQAIAPQVYRRELKDLAQLKSKSQQQMSPTAPPVYRPQSSPNALHSSAGGQAPPVYQPPSSATNSIARTNVARHVQAKQANTQAARPAGPPVYRPFALPPAAPPIRRAAVQRMRGDDYGTIKDGINKLLPYGAGNRKSDLEKTGNQSQFRVKAAANLGRKNRSSVSTAIEGARVPEVLASFMKGALNGVIVGAGNCLEQGAIGFFLAIEQFSGSTVYLMAAKGLDHQFALVAPPGTKSLEEGTVVDAWQPWENGKKLKDSSWTGSDKIAAQWNSKGETFLKDAVRILGESGIDEKARDQSIAAAAKEFSSSGNFFNVYEF